MNPKGGLKAATRTLLVLGLVFASNLGTAQAQEILGPPQENCSASKGGGGVGGNHVSCGFVCRPQSKLSVSVQSSDVDASVMGTAACADGTAQCSGKRACQGVGGPTAYAGTGTCDAYSDEFWRSSLSVSCSATAPGQVCTPITCPMKLVQVLSDAAGNVAVLHCLSACDARTLARAVEDPLVPTPETPSLVEILMGLGETWLGLASKDPDSALAKYQQAVAQALALLTTA